jgi:hypothetical protein
MLMREVMVDNKDVVGGFNRVSSTCNTDVAIRLVGIRLPESRLSFFAS